METEKKYITGRVTDEHQEPLLGVNILIKGTSQGTTTDKDGNYKLNAPIGSQLVFSFVGRKSKVSAPIQKDTAGFNIVLEEIAEELGEVVVTPHNKKENPIKQYYNPRTTITKKKSYNDTLKVSKVLLVGGVSLLVGLFLYSLDNKQKSKNIKKVAI